MAKSNKGALKNTWNYKGREVGATELSKLAGCSYYQMRKRLERMSPEDAVAQGPLNSWHVYNYNGKMCTLNKLARETNIPVSTLYYRLKDMSLEEALEYCKNHKRRASEYFEYKGQRMSVYAIAQLESVNKRTLSMALDMFCTMEEAIEYARARRKKRLDINSDIC